MQVTTLKQLITLHTLIVEHCEACGIPLVDPTSRLVTLSWWQTGAGTESETKAYAKAVPNGYFELKVRGETVHTTDIEVCRVFLASIRKSVDTVKPEKSVDDSVTRKLRKQYPTKFVRYWDENGFFVKVMNSHPVLKYIKLSSSSRTRRAHTYVSKHDFSRFCDEFYIIMGVQLEPSNFDDKRSSRSSRIRSYNRVEV